MNSQEAIEEYICHLYQQAGGNSSDIAYIRPIDGSWGSALSYHVFNKDGVHAVIMRSDIDDGIPQNIKVALSKIIKS